MRRLKTRSEQRRWILSEAANGLLLAPSWEKDAAVSCCHESVDWGMAAKTRRNGRRKKKWRRTKLEEKEREKGKEMKEEGGGGGEEAAKGMLGTGVASPGFHVPPLWEDCPSCALLGMLQKAAVTDQPRTGWGLCLGGLQKKGKHTHGEGEMAKQGKVYVIPALRKQPSLPFPTAVK